MALIKGKRTILLMLIAAVLAGTAVVSAAEKGGGTPETLKQYVADLKKNPENAELREKTIKYAQTLKQKPPVPEEYSRLVSRGSAYLKMAADTAGYHKAIDELRAAVNLAPWIPDAYENLAAAQEKAGLFAEAIQNLNFTLLADPNAKNAREIKNHTYELEVYAEDAKQALKASPNVALPAPPPPTPVKIAPVAKKPVAPDKKTNPKAFVGSWLYKDTAPRGGEQLTTQAFTINMGPDGRLIASAPRRSTGAVGTVTVFELDDDTIRVQITWKLATIPSYWKTEDYELTLSDNESKLKGTYRIKSSGKGEFSEDKVFFKQ
jgi:tetratricopeptide (TPR) repeat protein